MHNRLVHRVNTGLKYQLMLECFFVFYFFNNFIICSPDVIVTNQNNNNDSNAGANPEVDALTFAHQRAIAAVATLIQVNRPRKNKL